MSGHSKWATIKRSKGKADAARGKIFNRLIREITIAARMGGGDRENNARLRNAIASAKAQNMPSKNIDNAIAKGTGQLEGVTYEEFALEGYAPGGVAVLVECMSDNRNRTVSEVRHTMTRAGGNLGAANSVSYLFKAKGIIQVPKAASDEDKLMEIVLDAGAEDMSTEDDVFEISTAQNAYEAVRNALEKAGIQPSSAELAKVPDTSVPVEGETAGKVIKLIDALDDLDDVQHVWANFDVSEETMKKLGEI
jgi:YebC/PmpR family DNA-binding regulatory protein